ncbi:Protein Skeletor, isoforms B/C [Oopsacas minuta]|uniref:Protein Skeletor, isoforms B/C n=1 Tax=Oopsacas minuta TaxID=111878 RepID=A0AAV7KK00_9METZ|nr:Protein Skeletor, isoforms B/C [Oopsacas minuta]
MRLLTTLLVLQLVVTTSGFLRLGTINTGSISGRVYLIDANTLFLFEFTSPNNLNFSSQSGSATYTLTGPVTAVNMWFNMSANVLDSPTIRVTDGGTLIASFYVPNNVYIPCNAEYLGPFARPDGPNFHELDGHVFLDRSQYRFFVAGLDTDDKAPAAYMWLDTSVIPTAAGVRAGYNGGYGKVLDIIDIDANVTYPPEHVNTVFQSLSVWCVDFYVSFGQVTIPPAPATGFTCTDFGPVKIGFDPKIHDISGYMHVLGPNVIGLNSLVYDGTAVATWYWGAHTDDLTAGYIVQDQFSTLARLETEIIEDNIVLTLPNGTDVCDSYIFSVYCVDKAKTFGTIYYSDFECSGCPAMTCKTDVSTPPRTDDYQCTEIGTYFHVEYLYNLADDFITFRFHTCDLDPLEYIAFGISSSDSAVQMAPEGDPIVCYYQKIISW